MTKKSPEREISIKASGVTFRGNVELLTDAKLTCDQHGHHYSRHLSRRRRLHLHSL